jgi:cell division protein FtsA
VGTGRGGVYRGFARETGTLALFQRFARALREYF